MYDIDFSTSKEILNAFQEYPIFDNLPHAKVLGKYLDTTEDAETRKIKDAISERISQTIKRSTDELLYYSHINPEIIQAFRTKGYIIENCSSQKDGIIYSIKLDTSI